jgi:L-lactate permease
VVALLVEGGVVAAVAAAVLAAAGFAAVLAAAGAGAVADAAEAGFGAVAWAITALAERANARAVAEPRTALRKPADRKLIHLTPEKLANTAATCRHSACNRQ